MISGETESGIKFEIDEAMLDSMELLDALSDYDDANGGGLVHASDMLFTRKGKKKIYKQLEAKLGRKVRVSDFAEFFKEVFESIKDLKK